MLGAIEQRFQILTALNIVTFVVRDVYSDGIQPFFGDTLASVIR